MSITDSLKSLTSCKEIRLVRRGNKAIQYALRIAKALGKTKVLIQDQGGWITYGQYPPKMRLDLVKLKTDYGLINKDDLFRQADKDSVLLVNSMPGYHALEDMKTIQSICKDAGCLIINDISGSIGTDAAGYGDIVVCSFGSDKPIGLGEGGFIGTKNLDDFKIIIIDEVSFKSLDDRLDSLKERLKKINEIRKKVLDDMKEYDIIHKDMQGINVIIKYADEKEKIINYCESNNFEYTICPRYIRVDCDAVSIELKRLFKGDNNGL